MVAPAVSRRNVEATTEVETPAQFFGVEPAHLRRVSVVCGEFALDVVIPTSSVVAHLAAEIAELFLERARAAARDRGIAPVDVLCGPGPHGRWQLSRRTGGPFAAEETVLDVGVADGDTLLLAAPPLPTVEPLWDDSLAAVSARIRESRWEVSDSRLVAAATLTALAATLAITSVFLLVRGAGVAVTGLAAGCAVTAAAYTSIARAHGASPATGTAGVGATVGFVGLAAAGAVPGAPGVPHLFAGAAVGTAAAVVAAVLWPSVAPGTHSSERLSAFVFTVLGASAASGAALREWAAASSAQCATALLATGVLLVVTAPTLAVFLGGVRLPAASLDSDGASGPLDLAAVHAQAAAARRVLVHVVAAGGVLCAGGVVILLAPRPPGVWPWLLAVLTVAFLVLRPRTVLERTAGLWVLASGLVAALAVVVAAFAHAGSTVGLVVASVGALAVAIVVALAGWWVPERDFSPAARRVVDVLDIVVLAALPPLAVVVAGFVGAVRG